METNCPNCGAPITGIQCEYCGTVFHDDEYNKLLAKQAALELQANQARMNAMLSESLQPAYWNNVRTAAYQSSQAYIERMQSMQLQNLRDSINIYR